MLFHHFHQRRPVSICDAMNAAVCRQAIHSSSPAEFRGFEPETIPTLERTPRAGKGRRATRWNCRGRCSARARFVTQASEEDSYAAKADRIAIYNPLGDVVAVIELVSPGNKNARHAIRSFVDKTLDLLSQGINPDRRPFPPEQTRPARIHKVIWDEIRGGAVRAPTRQATDPLAYSAGVPKKAFVEPVAGGDTLSDMPVLLDPATYILAPRTDVRCDLGDLSEPLRELISAP